MNSQIKLAAGDQEFEQAFFQLAYDKLQGKLSNLIPFLVGFQLVKKSEDDTKAVGVFGFKSNNGQILFVPAFFINGKIKELNLLYSRNNNQFYPLNEDFAEMFLKDDVTGLGTSSNESRDRIQQSINNPNFRDVIWPPRTGRISYAEAKDLDEKNPEVLEKAAEQLTSRKNYAAPVALIDFVKSAEVRVKEAFWNLLSKRADFVDAVRTFYTDDQIADALRWTPPAAIQKEAALKVLDLNEAAADKKLGAKHRKEVATKGYTIVDNRPDSGTSDVGIFKFKEQFTNPTKSGFYPYITEMGTIRYGLVITQVENLKAGYSHPNALVIDLEAERKGQAYCAPANEVFIKDCIEVRDLSEAISQLEDPAESLPGYDDYILINDHLKATEPFRILENYKDASGIRRIKVEPLWMEAAKDRPNRGEKAKHICPMLVLTKRPGDRLEHKNHAVYVPKGFKLLKVHIGESYYPGVDYSLPDGERKKREKEIAHERERVRMGKPGKFCHLAGLLRENNVFPLTVHTNGSEYFLNLGGARAQYKDPLEAKIAMVAEVGLREKDAEALLADLPLNRKREGYIKVGTLGDHTLQLWDENPEHNEFGQPTYWGVPWVDIHDRADGYTKDPTKQGLGVKPDEASLGQTVDHAVELAQNGQKEIFDTQAIGALSKYVDSSNKVLDYVPNLVSTLDKLGRMLFLTYWDTETFEKVYGRDELPELIELVKNVFNNMGDLVIFLKRKVPDISINDNEQSKIDT